MTFTIRQIMAFSLLGADASPNLSTKAIRMLTVIDEYGRECLAIHVQRIALTAAL
ncbi:hypothetical protein [Parasphingorhabdus cellanae]|uniref:Transposase n=1 Tax=Parasphingorhabdus cellanae TaxID=2806553 RepID=A0ABX7T8T6_9SPHN|nr:hypothetical protein [Parasphingorhabdus cellanae]QTD57305.1 hypothetical protein J4G78_07175 [Parasphingorhabdus cellanae]